MNEKTKKAIDTVLAQLRDAPIKHVAHSLLIDSPCARWSLCNRLICLAAGTQDARGYRQWKEVGRHVKRGAKAFYILAPRIVKRRETRTNDITGEEEEIEVQVLVGFISVPVFRYEDTEGEPLVRKPVEPPPLIDVARAWGLEVKYSHLIGAFGAYDPRGEEITLNSDDAFVFFHELAHAAQKREFGKDAFNDRRRAEIVAEFCAAVVARLYGVEYEPAGVREYIERFAQGERAHRAALRFLADVDRVLRAILRSHENAGQPVVQRTED